MDNNINALEEDYLYIQQSQIPNSGKGLFTAIKIYKDIEQLLGIQLLGHAVSPALLDSARGLLEGVDARVLSVGLVQLCGG